MYELPSLFHANGCHFARGTRVGNFEAANVILKQEGQGAEVRVSWNTRMKIRLR